MAKFKVHNRYKNKLWKLRGNILIGNTVVIRENEARKDSER
jgi:hypothetical protein